jgi:hypothetical protein
MLKYYIVLIKLRFWRCNRYYRLLILFYFDDDDDDDDEEEKLF